MTKLIIPCWRNAYRPPALGENGIHVWRFPRRPTRPLPLRLAQLLSEDERARAAGFIRSEDRCAYLHCRWMLRRLLGQYLGIPTFALALDYGPSGKPSLPAPAKYEFNLSHAGDLALLGVSRQIPLGIDLEPLRPRRHLLDLARRSFDTDTSSRLSRQPPCRRLLPFYLAWTGLEAQVKAGGASLFAGLGQSQRASYTVLNWLPAPGYCAALAYPCRREAVQLRFLTPLPGLF